MVNFVPGQGHMFNTKVVNWTLKLGTGHFARMLKNLYKDLPTELWNARACYVLQDLAYDEAVKTELP